MQPHTLPTVDIAAKLPERHQISEPVLPVVVQPHQLPQLTIALHHLTIDGDCLPSCQAITISVVS